MPTYHKGNMYTEVKDAPVFFTANHSLRLDGSLVMGAGAALQAKLLFPDLDKRLGEKLRFLAIHEYNILYDDYSRIGALQVKYDWRRPASLPLIERSIWALDAWTKGATAVHFNFPGIGKGGLNPLHVMPLLDRLPEYHHIWER